MGIDRYLDLLVKKIPAGATPAEVVAMMKSAGLLNHSALIHLNIFLDFPAALRNAEGNYTNAYRDLAVKYKLSTRTIMRIIKAKRKSGIC